MRIIISRITDGMLLLRHSARLRTPTAVASRPMSILGAIFGIGEFEGARDQSLGASTSKQQAYDIAVLEVRGPAFPSRLVA